MYHIAISGLSDLMTLNMCHMLRLTSDNYHQVGSRSTYLFLTLNAFYC